MFKFLRQIMEKRCQSLQLEAKSSESVESMDISEEFLEVVQLSFEAKDLSEDSIISNDNVIKRLQSRMDILFYIIDTQANVKFDDIVVLAVTYYNLGLLHVTSEDLYAALTFFKTCLQLVQGKELDRKVILTSIRALIEINSILVKLEKNNHIYKFLNLAMELYLTYTKKVNYPEPIHIPTIIGIKENESINTKIILEDLHFTTLRDMATQYLIQPENKHEFVICMYNLLKEQLSQMISEERQFQEDCINWVLTLLDISKYFLVNNRFVEARNHLATADYMLYRFSEETLKTINQQNDVAKLRFIYLSDRYDYAHGISARSWGTYGVLLLRFWLEKFSHSEDKEYDVDNLKLEMEESQEESTNLLIFLDVKEEAESMTHIAHTRVLNLTDAKSVFSKMLTHFDAAKKYFTIDNDIETYAKIILEISAAYKYLAGFEQCRDIQLKLHKERVEHLEDVSKKFHTIIDVDTEFQTYKRVWCEIVTSCSTVIDLMLEETYHNETKNISKEVNRFAELILGNIVLYLRSV